ncbi:lipoprotein [Silanimonas sp.]|uniref:LPS translocon maturation chaperone LptM n=1 Tax=Silanimonas sp. TaxID=1929290 RepID=UPI001BB9801E|nr:lipoprotein [Silanimonas sp.]MBS3896488.1 sugar transporter [Silanimonas sp.]MBS3924428.1 sugar transporter [Xanthomonadaceae bacterium]
MKTLRVLLPLLIACALLAACGNKGDLVRPSLAEAPLEAPVEAPAATPAEA